MAAPEENLRKAFNLLDVNKDGLLQLAEIKKVLTDKGIDFSAYNFDEVFPKLDKDGDGKLKFEEFAVLGQEPQRSTFKPLFDKLIA